MTIWENIFQTTRRGSKERSELIKRFAHEKGISMATAFRWIYKERDRLDEQGNYHRRPRRTAGVPQNQNVDLMLKAKGLLRDRERSIKSVAEECGLSKDMVWRLSRGYFDHWLSSSANASGE